MKTARFPIGLEFDLYSVKHNKRRVITDILTTTGSKGNVCPCKH